MDTKTLFTLRQRIPIGIVEGLEILKSANGDLETAVSIIRNNYLGRVIRQTNASSERALDLLVYYKYDIERILELLYREIEEKHFTKTEVILRRYGKDKREALDQIAGAIEVDYPLKRHQGWLVPESLKQLNNFQLSVVAICEWLEYVDAENLECSLWLWPELVTPQIEDMNGWTKIGGALRAAFKIDLDTHEQYTHLPSPECYQLAFNSLRHDELYQQALAFVEQHKILLINSLFRLVTEHIDEYPI